MKNIKPTVRIFTNVLLFQLLFFGISCAQEHRGEESEGKNSRTHLSKSQTFDKVKSNVRLILKYDAKTAAFVGSIENISKKEVNRARVEIHLSNGVELGPTTPTSLKAGEIINISLPAVGQEFETWTTHAEVGSSEQTEESSSERGSEGNHGEGGERNEESDGENKEQGESGTKFLKSQTANETINGIHAIISFNTSKNTFEGTFENLNSNIAQQTRLEVHVYNAKGNTIEFGPTQPVDMKSRTKRTVSLPITAGTSFVKFSMHPEVGVSGSRD